MTITHGNRHTFLGIDFWFPGNGKIQIHMPDYIQEAIDNFREQITWIVSTPATCELFDEDEVTSMLDVEHGGKFRSMVMKLQWIAEHGRPDMQLSLSYLTTPLTKATTLDWQKLR